MKLRLQSGMEGKKLPVTMGTFHGIYYGILNGRIGSDRKIFYRKKISITGSSDCESSGWTGDYG